MFKPKRESELLPKTGGWEGFKVGPKKKITVIGDPLSAFDVDAGQSKPSFFVPQAGQKGINGDAPSALRDPGRNPSAGSEEKNVFEEMKTDHFKSFGKGS